MVSKILVNTGSGNGLLPDGTKPLPEPVMTNHQQGLVTIWRFYYGLIKFFCDLKHIDWYDIMNMHRFLLLIIPSAQRSCWGVYWFHSVHPSDVRPASHDVRYVAPTVLVGSISYLHILSSNFRRRGVFQVFCKIAKFEFFAIFLNM